MTESSEPSGRTGTTQEEPVIHLEQAEAVVSSERGPTQPTLEGMPAPPLRVPEADRFARGSIPQALTEGGRAALAAWISKCLRSGGIETAKLAARIATTLRLNECGAALLECAARRPREDRDTFIAALAALNFGPATLAALLLSIDTAYRPEAIRVLWMIRGREVESPLRAGLHDGAWAVRAATLEILATSGDPLALNFAETASTQDPSPEVRSVAARVLKDADADQMLAALDHALRDPSPEVRRTALEVLPDRVAGDPSSLVLRAIGDEDESVRGEAMRWIAGLPPERDATVWDALGRTDGPARERLALMLLPEQAERLERLCLVHARDPNPTHRAMAVELARLSMSRSCLEAVAKTLRDPMPAVRRAATATLGLVPDPTWLVPLKEALADPDVDTRVGAVNALRQIHHDDAVDALVGKLMDPEPEVQLAAGRALESLRSTDLTGRLIAALGRPELRDQAGQILVRWGEFVVDALVDALVEADAETAEAAGRVLRVLASSDRFRDSIVSLEPRERLRAVEALAAIRGPDAAHLLSSVLWDPDQGIRTRALQRLADIGTTEQASAVARCLRGEPVPEVATIALETLTRLGGHIDER